MKIKQPKTQNNTEEDVESSVREEKITNGEKSEVKSVKIVDKTIFEHFNALTNDGEQERMQAGLSLLQQLSKTKEPEKRKKEIAYTLKRLVRGCGASTNSSRAGFFTGLVAFLSALQGEELLLEDIFACIQKELHVGATIGNKEDADAVVGKILVCGAILHSEMSKKADTEQLEKIVNELIVCSRHRTYHTSLSYAFLIELMETLSVKEFEASVWPLLHKELQKPWSKQTIQTVHCLIFISKKFPSIANSKYFKIHFGGVELLNEDSFNHLYKIFWDHSNSTVITHPGFESFGSYIANCRKLTEFWTQIVDPGIATPNKLLEIETLKIATDIFNNLNTEKTNMTDLLSDNFMKLIVEGLKTVKQKKEETLIAFYSEFLDALTTCYTKLQHDENKVAVIKRLILPPGAFNIEKYTQTRIIHQLINSLGEKGIIEIYGLYKDIFMDKVPKNTENVSDKWLNFERMNAGFMLQNLLAHKSIQNAYKWREKELSFLLNVGIFYTTDSLELCKKETASSFSNDFGEQCKNMFYTSLQSKLHDLNEEKNLLLQLVRNCNKHLQNKHALKYLRLKAFDDKLQKTWQSMYDVVSSENVAKKAEKQKTKKGSAEKNDKLELVFHILLLNMGLQLFREYEMAAPAIDDLLKCMQRTKNYKIEQTNEKSVKLKSSANTKTDEEPEWIEVVIDLFLHLLSQNASALRNIVNSLFPHFCVNLNLNAVHQILSVLEMKDGMNPLSAKSEALDEDYSEDDEDKDVKNSEVNSEIFENGDDNNVEETDSDGDDDDDDDGDDDDEDDGDDDDDDEEVTATDKLRNAISQVLIENGGVSRDDDMDSIDLNDITEEEGKKLDDALANAFKAMKKTSTQNGSQNKKSKSYRVQTTTIMHFRIRVLDLIEIYLQHQPSLLILVEIMLVLYDMLEYCVTDELKPLQSKVEKVLNKLTLQKTYPIDADFSEESLTNFIRLIVEKKTSNASYEMRNRLRNKCIIFLISSVNKIEKSTSEPKSSVLSLCSEYIQDFVKSRNPVVNISLLSDIFKLRWLDLWQLVTSLAEQTSSSQIRTFRRIQIYELLLTLYKNFDLHRLDLNATKCTFKLVEKYLAQRIQNLASLHSDKQSSKEFQTLLELLLQIHRTHLRLQWQSTLSNDKIFDEIQKIRQLIYLDSAQTYQRFCSTFKLTQIRNSDLHIKSKQQNGATDELSDGQDTVESKVKNVAATAVSKRKLETNKDTRKLKKQKKFKRLETSSQGLNGGVPFGQKLTAVND